MTERHRRHTPDPPSARTGAGQQGALAALLTNPLVQWRRDDNLAVPGPRRALAPVVRVVAGPILAKKYAFMLEQA